MRQLAAVMVLVTSCGPASRFVGAGTGPIEWEVDDPRCVPSRRDYQPTLRLVSDSGLADAGFLAWQSVEVRVEGLPPCRPLDMIFGQAVGGLAYAVFRADFDGVVSTATQAPLRGSWAGADIDGPIYSSEGGLFVQDVSVLADWGAPAYLEATWVRRSLPFGVDVLPVRGSRGVFGDLYLPASAGPFPIIVVIDGERGVGAGAELARTFVEQGYLVLTVASWGADPLPLSFERLPLEYFLSAIEVAKEYPGARRDRVGLIGVARGAEAALQVAAASPDVKAVVSVVGSGVVWPAGALRDQPAWTLADAGVAFVPWAADVQPAVQPLDDGGVIVSTRGVWGEVLRRAGPAAVEAATIRVEDIQAPILFFGGDDDRVWPSCTLADVAWDRLVDAGHPGRFPLDARVCFSGAGHVINPGYVGLPMGSSLFANQDDGGFVELGGSAKANAAASRESWLRASALFERTLKQP
jgi:hypothetical protein